MKKILLFVCSLVLLGAGCAKTKAPKPVQQVKKTDTVGVVATNTTEGQGSEKTRTSTISIYEKRTIENFDKAGKPATAEEIQKMNSAEKTTCEKAGGSWKKLGGCADICMFERAPALRSSCPSVDAYGCDCGADKCWNGTTCEKN